MAKLTGFEGLIQQARSAQATVAQAKPRKMYNSSSKGLIEISSMNSRHLFYAIRKLSKQTFDELVDACEHYEDLETLLDTMTMSTLTNQNTVLENLVEEYESRPEYMGL